MAEEPDNLTLRLLRDIREQMATMATKEDLAGVAGLAGLATKDDLAALEARMERTLTSEINSLRADVASDMIVNRKELSEQIVGLRRAVIEYHSTTVGHGVLFSALEARLRRVEQHIGLSPLASH